NGLSQPRSAAPYKQTNNSVIAGISHILRSLIVFVGFAPAFVVCITQKLVFCSMPELITSSSGLSSVRKDRPHSTHFEALSFVLITSQQPLAGFRFASITSILHVNICQTRHPIIFRLSIDNEPFPIKRITC